MPRKAATPVTVTPRSSAAKDKMAAIARDNPALARRLQSGNINGGGTQTLPLKEPHRWHTYRANTYASENAYFEMKELGWIPLLVADLDCRPEEVGWTVSPDGYLTRDQGREMLWKMDKDHYRVLEQIRTESNMRGIGSASKIKGEMAEITGKEFGDEAGTYISNLPGQVIDSITGDA